MTSPTQSNRLTKDRMIPYAINQALHNSGFEVGPASGAVVHVARMQPEEENILVLFSDHGDKYLEKINSWKRHAETK